MNTNYISKVHFDVTEEIWKYSLNFRHSISQNYLFFEDFVNNWKSTIFNYQYSFVNNLQEKFPNSSIFNRFLEEFSNQIHEKYDEMKLNMKTDIQNCETTFLDQTRKLLSSAIELQNINVLEQENIERLKEKVISINSNLHNRRKTDVINPKELLNIPKVKTQHNLELQEENINHDKQINLSEKEMEDINMDWRNQFEVQRKQAEQEYYQSLKLYN